MCNLSDLVLDVPLGIGELRINSRNHSPNRTDPYVSVRTILDLRELLTSIRRGDLLSLKIFQLGLS